MQDLENTITNKIKQNEISGTSASGDRQDTHEPRLKKINVIKKKIEKINKLEGNDFKNNQERPPSIRIVTKTNTSIISNVSNTPNPKPSNGIEIIARSAQELKKQNHNNSRAKLQNSFNSKQTQNAEGEFYFNPSSPQRSLSNYDPNNNREIRQPRRSNDLPNRQKTQARTASKINLSKKNKEEYEQGNNAEIKNHSQHSNNIVEFKDSYFLGENEISRSNYLKKNLENLGIRSNSSNHNETIKYSRVELNDNDLSLALQPIVTNSIAPLLHELEKLNLKNEKLNEDFKESQNQIKIKESPIEKLLLPIVQKALAKSLMDAKNFTMKKVNYFLAIDFHFRCLALYVRSLLTKQKYLNLKKKHFSQYHIKHALIFDAYHSKISLIESDEGFELSPIKLKKLEDFLAIFVGNSRREVIPTKIKKLAYDGDEILVYIGENLFIAFLMKGDLRYQEHYNINFVKGKILYNYDKPDTYFNKKECGELLQSCITHKLIDPKPSPLTKILTLASIIATILIITTYGLLANYQKNNLKQKVFTEIEKLKSEPGILVNNINIEKNSGKFIIDAISDPLAIDIKSHLQEKFPKGKFQINKINIVSIDDQIIEKRLNNLKNNSEFDFLAKINFKVNQGKVTINGTISKENYKKLLDALASNPSIKQIQAGKSLQITPPNTQAQSLKHLEDEINNLAIFSQTNLPLSQYNNFQIDNLASIFTKYQTLLAKNDGETQVNLTMLHDCKATAETIKDELIAKGINPKLITLKPNPSAQKSEIYSDDKLILTTSKINQAYDCYIKFSTTTNQPN